MFHVTLGSIDEKEECGYFRWAATKSSISTIKNSKILAGTDGEPIEHIVITKLK